MRILQNIGYSKNKLKLNFRRFSNKIEFNIPKKIYSKIHLNLHKNNNLPIGIVKEKIERFFVDYFKNESKTKVIDSINPKVLTTDNFDTLLIGDDHPSRCPTQTFYFDADHVLRTHTTSHDFKYLKKGYNALIISGDCYRRDTIDSSHFPIFHQIDVVHLMDKSKYSLQSVSLQLKSALIALIKHLFGDIEYRWNKDYFPFTDPSYELEIMYDGKWIEVLGCGILRSEILKMAGRNDKIGWAFGMGLERIAMALFKIPDIRLFHSSDKRFETQFKRGEISEFRPFSKFPACFKDVSFWVPPDFDEKAFVSIVEDSAGKLLESVELIDKYEDKQKHRRSFCYRLSYRSFSKNLLNEEVDAIQAKVLESLEGLPGIKLRS